MRKNTNQFSSIEHREIVFLLRHIPPFLPQLSFFLERFGRSDDECADVQHLIRFMMIVVVNVVLGVYHEREMMKKKLEKVKLAYCDICHDRTNPSPCNNNKNKNKNMRTPPMSIRKKKKENKYIYIYMGNDVVRMSETAMMMMIKKEE